MIAPDLVEIGGACGVGDGNATRNPGTVPDTYLSIDAIEAWQSDPDCVAAGDEYATLAVRSYSAAGLSNTAIAQRIQLFGTNPAPPERYDAAIAVARHGAFVGASARQIVACLARLACEVPCWPTDPTELASMTRAALQEVGR